MDRSARLPRRARVTGRRVLCPTGTIHLAFAVVDGEPFAFEPGQFVAIDLHHPELGYRRSPYCIASPVDRPDRFELLVRVIPEGPLSVFLGDLAEGDVIGFSGPTGRAMTAPAEGAVVLLATGVGISPFLPLVHRLLQRGARRPVHLYWGLRQREDICLTDVLDGWTAGHPNFRYRISLSRPDAAWRGLHGRLTESVPPLLETLQGASFFLCGNGAMIAEMSAALSLAGVPLQRLIEEPFFNLRHRPDHAVVEAIHARFRARDREAAPFAAVARFLDS